MRPSQQGKRNESYGWRNCCHLLRGAIIAVDRMQERHCQSDIPLCAATFSLSQNRADRPASNDRV